MLNMLHYRYSILFYSPNASALDNRTFFPATFHALIVDQNLWGSHPANPATNPPIHPLLCIAPSGAALPTLVNMLCWLLHWTFVVNAAIVAGGFGCSALSTWLFSGPIWLFPEVGGPLEPIALGGQPQIR